MITRSDQKILIGWRNEKLVSVLKKYTTKEARDSVIKAMSANSELTVRQRMNFIDFARTLWRYEDEEKDRSVRVDQSIAKANQSTDELIKLLNRF